MPIIPLKCPSCGADLQADSNSPILSCPFCGTNSVMKDAIVQNYIRNTVNITAGTVNVTGQKDFVIEAGVLKEYHGESPDVIIPDNVVEIANSAFSGSKIKTVVIPNSVTSIEGGTFNNCTSLVSVTIPNSVTVIGEGTFNNCTSLVSVTIPNSVTKIEPRAFSHCTSLVSVTIPNSVIEIGDISSWIDDYLFIGAFRGCTSLTAIEIPESVRLIGFLSFAECTSLASVTIRCREAKIGYYPFTKCCSLQSVNISNPQNLTGQPIFEGTPLYEQWRQKKRCRYCGGELKGFISPKCTCCGKYGSF